MSAGLQRFEAPDAFTGQVSPLPAGALLELGSVAGIAAADAGFPTSFQSTWSADSSDTLLLGTELTWVPSRLVTALALAPALVVAAELAAADGSMAGAAGYLLEFEEATTDVAAQYREAHLAAVARVAVAVGEAEMARIERMLAASQGLVLRDRLNVASVRAIVAEHRGDLAAAAELYRAAAEGWRSFGNPLEEAEALLGLARCVGDDSAADAKLARERAAKIMSGLGINAP